VLSTLLVSLVLLVGLSAWTAPTPAGELPAHHLQRGFRNVDPGYDYSLLERTKRLLTLKAAPPRGSAPTVVANDGVELRANGFKPTITWVGHSTFLIQIAGVNILTDPTWSERASPVGFAGPRRLVPPGLQFDDLPPIDVVVISHDHYDHLDAPTVERILREHHPLFVVPLGLKSWLASVGITEAVELDWWDSARVRGLTLTCTPAQHSSGRGLRDQNLRLWASWVIASPSRRLYFAGDTGYYPGLVEIGRRLGPFDLALLPIGGYNAYATHHPNHLNPEEAVRLFQELGARVMVPMHYGTFDFNREPFREPPDRLLREALRRAVEARIAILRPGETLHW
jgi:N-acyl-phosphatidylethanolamine-hydrolysing phospholipase D